ncbi:MAG: hypothetical protein LPK14_07685 [Hymenobacteraceae bacterium]|nr:hypothetical protein [Hymenobacteraceae bacterium]
MKILELELETARLRELKDFYNHTLEFKLLEASEQRFCLAVGATRLCFKRAATGQAGGYHFAFNIPYPQFEEAASWLQERVTVLPDPQTKRPVVVHEEWQAKAVYLFDPEGNIVEYIAHETLPAPAVNAPFEAAQVLSVCEIGLPVPQVPVFAAELKQKLQLRQWKTGNARFEAVGDVHGMFILAEENRPWFPTGQGAKVLPTRVLIQTDGAEVISHGCYQIMQPKAVRLQAR